MASDTGGPPMTDASERVTERLNCWCTRPMRWNNCELCRASATAALRDAGITPEQVEDVVSIVRVIAESCCGCNMIVSVNDVEQRQYVPCLVCRAKKALSRLDTPETDTD